MSKLILVSNRLPVTVEIDRNGVIQYVPSVGGLATGLASLSQGGDCRWVGFSGVYSDNIKTSKMNEIVETLAREHNSQSVALTKNDVKFYYNGFSNKTIWPLFHYFTNNTVFREEMWKSYVSVNRRFFDAFSSVYEEGDLVWIQDYHLMLLPALIRQHMPRARVGFFLHIPFPSYELFRLLPWRREILSGLLGADLIGFHTFGYLSHFLNSVQRIIGIDHSMGQLQLDGRAVRCDMFPLGIDYPRYSQYLPSAGIQSHIDKMRDNLKGRKMVLSMDRLDFTKGIIERLEAFERFLEKYPAFHDKVQIILVAVPSRTKVDTYVSLREKVNETVGRINGRYNTLGWSPIRYMYRSLSFEMIMTLYHCADVCVVTPLRDGMNLVAKEYIAARTDGDGVLVLSEMAGAAEELSEAIIVNPHNTDEVAESIAAALTMDVTEQREAITAMRRRLKKNDVAQWTSSFIDKLSAPPAMEIQYTERWLIGDNLKGIVENFSRIRERVLFLDYDGTLVRFRARPQDAIPDTATLTLLGELAEIGGTDVVVISGRARQFMDRYFADLPVTLVSDHGAWIRTPGGSWTQAIPCETQWKNEIRPLLEQYSDRTPGSFVEEKDFSLAWHYRRCDVGLSSMRLMELKGNLLNMVANHNLGIIDGEKVLEIRSHDINKGKIVTYLLSLKGYEFILGVGDGATDEDLFRAIPENGYSVKVGYGKTAARFFIEGVDEVHDLLRRLLDSAGGGPGNNQSPG
ncbi:MAG: bifunctional alpha,alpha-trehalose-phosphate synthase (UDP-forming)/trehalose-phosphatase [Spirochaetes bacterium]|nr:bifunctional alpha,alpha-trehalose-phosphate synthase (UDP-forming)/trehalose-phosphatase [Spirochaetota bacterium]